MIKIIHRKEKPRKANLYALRHLGNNNYVGLWAHVQSFLSDTQAC